MMVVPDSLDWILTGLRAAAEPSRLRLLMICAQGEWTVTELTQILGQSQPRVSRHVKILVDAGLAERAHDTADRRVVFVRASPQGLALIARFREVGRERMRHVLAYVPEDALPALVSGMRALTEAVALADADLPNLSKS
jgi:DNA-binding MarR family transcriptional regulator